MTKMLHILHQKQSATVVDMQLTVTIIICHLLLNDRLFRKTKSCKIEENIIFYG